MQEIVPGIYYENSFPGVTLGAITLPRGTILIDSPLRAEDGRTWRAALLNRGSGIDRILVNLDAHPDRTIGSRSLECPVIAHQMVAMVFRTRPPTFKIQSMEVGAEWETCSDLGSSRWAPPDITFSEQMFLNWGAPQVILEYHPGPASGASWVVIPEAHVIFIGDAVPMDQPPFLADAELPAWIETLNLLLKPEFRKHTLISGRGGPVTSDEIRRLRDVLSLIEDKITTLWARNAPVEEVDKLIPNLIGKFKFSTSRSVLYEQRLRHGLRRNYTRRYQPADEFEITEEE